MIKSQLISQLAAKITDISEKQVNDGVNHIIDLMRKTLLEGKRIEIRRFGSFSLHYRASRKAHNPKTGEEVVTKPKQRPHFKPGKDLRERVNASRFTITLAKK